jgi:hypothetical protein
MRPGNTGQAHQRRVGRASVAGTVTLVGHRAFQQCTFPTCGHCGRDHDIPSEIIQNKKATNLLVLHRTVHGAHPCGKHCNVLYTILHDDILDLKEGCV